MVLTRQLSLYFWPLLRFSPTRFSSLTGETTAAQLFGTVTFFWDDDRKIKLEWHKYLWQWLKIPSFFRIVVHYGDTIAAWRKAGYQDDPKHEAFKYLLEQPKEAAQVNNFPRTFLYFSQKFHPHSNFLEFSLKFLRIWWREDSPCRDLSKPIRALPRPVSYLPRLTQWWPTRTRDRPPPERSSSLMTSTWRSSWTTWRNWRSSLLNHEIKIELLCRSCTEFSSFCDFAAQNLCTLVQQNFLTVHISPEKSPGWKQLLW